METTNNQYDFSKLSEPFQSLIGNKEYTFQFYDLHPIPIEIFGADGKTIYINRACMEMMGITDINLLVGIYNLWKDPVCIGIMGKEVIDRIFRGEAVTFPDFPAPIQDVYDRGVIEEKPWEASTMDLYFQPIWDGNKFICTICFFFIKNMYKGRADVADAKKYIDEHWLDEFNPDAVAKAVNISPTHLRALFKQHAGMTMHDYYNKVKVDHIKEKLADRTLSINEAFDACNVDSQGWIARVFKEMTSMSPTEYRNGLK